MSRNEVRNLSIFVIALGVVLASLILRNVIDTAQALELIVLFSLVAVTGIYVKRTAEMAKETREQRYESVRPIIDIQREEQRGTHRAIAEAIAGTEGDESYGLSCELHNIGLGPAIDVYSFVQSPNHERKRWDFGTIANEKNTEAMVLSVEHPNNRTALVACYKDIYGRAFKSSRKVGANPNGSRTFGPLAIQLIKLRELP